jgi:DNA binding domain, excisionase family
MTEEDELLTAQEVANMIKVDIRTVRIWVSQGELAIVRIGKREYRIKRSEVNRFIDEREERKQQD